MTEVLNTARIEAMTDLGLSMSNVAWVKYSGKIVNGGGSIDQGMESALRSNPAKVRGSHIAKWYCGRVWFEEGRFHEEVWKHGVPVEVISADTLQDLMDTVNANHSLTSNVSGDPVIPSASVDVHLKAHLRNPGW